MSTRAAVRAALLMELWQHEYRDGLCACGQWNGHDAYNGHVADALLAILYPRDP